MCSTPFLLVTNGSDRVDSRQAVETDRTASRAILFRVFAADSVVRSIRTQKIFDRALQELSIDVKHNGPDFITNRLNPLKEVESLKKLKQLIKISWIFMSFECGAEKYPNIVFELIKRFNSKSADLFEFYFDKNLHVICIKIESNVAQRLEVFKT